MVGVSSPLKKCPVCGNDAKDAGERDYGDKVRIDCPRCGPFEASRTALTMMDGRLGDDELARARLSHALRGAPKRDDEWFMIASTNLDELIALPLPDIDHQIKTLLLWLSIQLRDDQLGSVRIENEEYLAGMVGAVDGQRVKRLLKHACSERLIEIIDETQIALTIKGWGRINEKVAQPEVMPSAATETKAETVHDETKVVKANCNTCGGERDAFLRRSYTKPGHEGAVSWSDTIETLECRGCGGLSVRRRFWFSEWESIGSDPLTGEIIRIPGIEETVWPAPSRRPKPDWVDEIEDGVIRTVAEEVYKALDQGLNVLATIGTRTLLDRAMDLRVGDQGNFPSKLQAMVDAGRMGEGEKDTFIAITDAGGAAAHRGFVPDKAVLDSVMSATEAFLHRELILPQHAKAVRDATPRRTKDTK